MAVLALMTLVAILMAVGVVVGAYATDMIKDEPACS